MLLSACSGTDKEAKAPVVVAAKPAVKAEPPEEPVLPKLKPNTQKRKPASPKLTEDEPEATAPATEQAEQGADMHQQEIVEQGAAPAPDAAADAAQQPNAESQEELEAMLPAPEVISAEPEPEPAWGVPDELKSKAENDVARLLGRPTTVRREGTGTIWTYRAGTCALDVYFFLDVADNKRRALSYEFLPEGADDAAISSCYRTLKEAKHVQ